MSSALYIISSPYVNSTWSYGLETTKLGFDLRDLHLWPGHHLCQWQTDRQNHSQSCFVHHFVAIGDFKLELQWGNAKFVSKSLIFCPRDLEIWWKTPKNNRVTHMSLQVSEWLSLIAFWETTDIAWTSLLSMVNNCWKFHMTGTLWKRCDRQIDGQTDDGQKCS